MEVITKFRHYEDLQKSNIKFLNAEMNKGPHFCEPLFLLVPIIGFELMTYRLQGGCSTN